MRQLHGAKRRKRALLALIVAALLIPGSFGHVLAQDSDQENVPPTLTSAPQVPEALTEPATTEPTTPTLELQLFLPMISGAPLPAAEPSPTPEVFAAGVTNVDPTSVQPATPARVQRTYLPMISGFANPRQLLVPAQILIDAINVARAKAGCAALRADSRLIQAAQVHSDDMARHAFLGHEGSDRSMPAERVVRAGYPMSYVGETIYHGAGTDAATVSAHWMESEPHRRILLRCTTKDIGAAGSASYWTVVVGNHF